MVQNQAYHGRKAGEKRGLNSNVKTLPKYNKFGQIIRYMRLGEYRKFIDGIDSRKHRLMFERHLFRGDAVQSSYQ